MRRSISIIWLELYLHILESHFLLFGLLFYYIRNHEMTRADPQSRRGPAGHPLPLSTAHAEPPTKEMFLLQTQKEAASCPQFTLFSTLTD